MTTHSLLKKATERGITLIAVDGRIKGRGPKPDPAFMAKLRAHEAEIVALLSAKSEPDIPASSATAERDVAPALASIPARYRHALARFKSQRPGSVTPFQFDQAVWAAEMFLVQWSSKAMEFGWTTGDLFDYPRDGINGGGLVWWLGTEIVTALGPQHAVTEQNRVFDRVTRACWINPYLKEGLPCGKLWSNPPGP